MKLNTGLIRGLTAVGMLSSVAATNAVVVPAAGESKIAVFELSGPLLESPGAFTFGFELEENQSLHGLLTKLKKLKTDDDVKAVVFSFNEPTLGWAQMQELRSAIGDIRASDKEVYFYLEEAGGGLYQLATSASKIYLSPTGTLDVTGLYLERAYFKGLLDWLRVEADLLHVGDFKSAGEPFTRTGPSEEAEEMYQWLVKDLYDQMVETIATGRQIPESEVRSLIDRGPFHAKEAISSKLVDGLVYAEDFTSTLKERYGADVEFDRKYGEDAIPEIDFSNPFKLMSFFSQMMKQAQKVSQNSIAVVYVDGIIVTGKTEQGLFGDSDSTGSTTLRRVLNKVARDDTIKAVVLRVDSPGGSALASDVIWHATTELADKKPFIVSMGNVAASGGYYVSAAGRTIFADPGTITGSIGVIGGKLVTQGLWDRVGISFHATQFGENADLFTTMRKFNDDERALVQQYLERVYAEFTDRVKSGRGDRLKKGFDEIGGGRVYTGRQAMEHGLVDRLGGLQDAIKFAASEAKLSDYEVREFPEAQNFLDLFIQGLTGQSDDEENPGVRLSASKTWLQLKPSILRELLPVMEALDPMRARSVLRSLMRIQLLSRENALLVTPAEILIR